MLLIELVQWSVQEPRLANSRVLSSLLYFSIPILVCEIIIIVVRSADSSSSGTPTSIRAC